jgi:hypothetical protein
VVTGVEALHFPGFTISLRVSGFDKNSLLVRLLTFPFVAISISFVNVFIHRTTSNDPSILVQWYRNFGKQIWSLFFDMEQR